MKYLVTQNHRSEYPDPITFSKGERLVVGELYEGDGPWDGWYFCTAINQKQGWVPKQMIEWVNDHEGIAGKIILPKR